MQFEFLELSPHLSTESGQIMAGRISLLGCLRNRSKHPLTSFPRRDGDGGGGSEQKDCHHQGDLDALSGIRLSPKANWRDQRFSVWLHCTWGLLHAGRCTVRTQSFGNSRDIWGYGNLLASRVVNHYTSKFNLESALQVYYYTQVMLVN